MSDIVEDWMPIPGFSGYEAGSYGSIRKAGGSYAAMRLQRSRTGYLSVTLRTDDGKTKKVMAHRAVALAWLGEPKGDAIFVAHLDGSRDNNVPSNLMWATKSENERHKRFHGTALIGTKNHCSKLNDKAVLVLRKRHANGESVNSLAKEIGIATQTAREIIMNGTWQHLPVFDKEGDGPVWRFEKGDFVRTLNGSFSGYVTKKYSTAKNPRGYVVRPSMTAGKVRIYPDLSLESALQSEER